MKPFLAATDTPPPVTVGFKGPYDVAKLCLALGKNLGGNAANPEWFEGHDVCIMVRMGSNGTPYMPTAALLRRRADGALRFVASDHVLVPGSEKLGADRLVGRREIESVMEAIHEVSVDEPGAAEAISAARRVLDAAAEIAPDGVTDFQSVRDRDDDLVDEITIDRMRDPVVRMRARIEDLRSSERRSAATAAFEAFAAALGLDEPR